MGTNMKYHILIVLQLFWIYAKTMAETLEEVAESFPCGLQPCARRGYDVCIGPPDVKTENDSYCYHCSKFKATCGKMNQRLGCHLYCIDTAVEAERRKWAVNMTRLQAAQEEWDNQLSVHENLHKEALSELDVSHTYLIASVTVSIVLILVIFGLVITLIIKVRYNRGQQMDGEIEDKLSDDGEEKVDSCDSAITDNKPHYCDRPKPVAPQQGETDVVVVTSGHGSARYTPVVVPGQTARLSQQHDLPSNGSHHMTRSPSAAPSAVGEENISPPEHDVSQPLLQHMVDTSATHCKTV